LNISTDFIPNHLTQDYLWKQTRSVSVASAPHAIYKSGAIPMSARAIRRAAERKSLKQSRQDGIPSPANSAHLVVRTRRATANRADSHHSTGPKTEEGKAKSSLNAVKTGLIGRIVLLPTDDAKAYQLHLDRVFRKHAPTTDPETTLTQTIADSEMASSPHPSSGRRHLRRRPSQARRSFPRRKRSHPPRSPHPRSVPTAATSPTSNPE